MSNDWYIKQIRTRLDIGLYTESMSDNLQQLHDRKEISDSEYAELQQKINEILRKREQSQPLEVHEEKPELVVEEYTDTPLIDKNQNIEKETSPKQEENKVTSESAEESAIKEESVYESPQKAEWISDCRKVLYQWSVSHADRKIKNFDAQENSFTATFNDNVVLNFKSPNSAVIKPSNPDLPKAEDFDTLMAIAKNKNKKIRLSDNMSEEFRNALIEACAKAEVSISNLTEEGKALYDSYTQKPEEKSITEDDLRNTDDKNDNKNKVLNEFDELFDKLSTDRNKTYSWVETSKGQDDTKEIDGEKYSIVYTETNPKTNTTINLVIHDERMKNDLRHIVRIKVPQELIGKLVGKGGKNVRALEEKYGKRIKITALIPEQENDRSSEDRSPKDIKRQNQIDEIRRNIQKSMGTKFISATDEDILNAMSDYVKANINKLPSVLDANGLKDLQHSLTVERNKQIAFRNRYNSSKTQTGSM